MNKTITQRSVNEFTRAQKLKISSLTAIKPVIGDDSPYYSTYLRDVDNEHNFNVLIDSYLEPDYQEYLNMYFQNYEIKQITIEDFVRHLKVDWFQNRGKFEAYKAELDKYGFMFNQDVISIEGKNDINSENSQTRNSTDNFIEMAIQNDDESPSTKNTSNRDDSGDSESHSNYSSDKYKFRDYQQVNRGLTNVMSPFDYLVKIFEKNFIIMTINLR